VIADKVLAPALHQLLRHGPFQAMMSLFHISVLMPLPRLDKEIHPLDFLTGQERRDLLNFLNS
jgi:hypothetical protein